jgi:hypothetical protein
MNKQELDDFTAVTDLYMKALEGIAVLRGNIPPPEPPKWVTFFWDAVRNLCEIHDVKIDCGMAEVEGAFVLTKGYVPTSWDYIHNKWCDENTWLVEEDTASQCNRQPLDDDHNCFPTNRHGD